MKKGLAEFGIFTLFLLIFFSFGVFAAPPSPGTCSIVIPAECVAASGNYRVMGLSSATNAHAQFPYVDYPYVLCCGFGTGNTTCVTTPSNKALGVSSSTNAHAEAPEQSTYLTKVCYEDLECISTASNCGTGVALSYKLNFTSLSSLTNAHVGAIDDFPNKICCKSKKFLATCVLTAASWNQIEANEGVQVFLTATGSGVECNGQTLNVEVIGATVRNASSVSFVGGTALSSWTAQWQSAGILGGDKSYQFNASVSGILNYVGKSRLSSNSLTVRQISSPDHCQTITSCEEYTDPNECNTDTPCHVAVAEGISQGIACDALKTYCGCAWKDGSCGFVWTEIQPEDCSGGYTLCHDSSSGLDYCFPGNSCPPGDETNCDNDATCDSGEGCTCADCDGQQDGCLLGNTCSSGTCTGIPPTEITCGYGFTLCIAAGVKYCFPGNTCPPGETIPGDNDGLCELGEGCTSNDCHDGDQDSCESGTYCISGMCSSVEDPITVDPTGGCRLSQTIEKECDEDPAGYKIVSWTGEWNGTIDTLTPAYQRCIAGGRTTIPCPAQIQLPFFGYYGLIITVVVITLIYVSLILRKKK